MAAYSVPVLTAEQIADAIAKPSAQALRKESHVYKIDYTHPLLGYETAVVVKFMPHEQAVDQYMNARLAALVGTDYVHMYPLEYSVPRSPYQINKKDCDGVLVMQVAPGRSGKQIGATRWRENLAYNTSLQEKILYDFMAAVVLNNDGVTEEDVFYNYESKTMRWIDPERGLTTNALEEPMHILQKYTDTKLVTSKFFPNVLANKRSRQAGAEKLSEISFVVTQLFKGLNDKDTGLANHLEIVIDRANKLERRL